MKAYRNTKEMQRKEAMGRRFSLVGLLILFVGMIASFIPNWYPQGAPTPNAAAAFLQQYWALASFIALPVFSVPALAAILSTAFAAALAGEQNHGTFPMKCWSAA